MPGPMPQTTTSKPFAFAHASAEAVESAWTSPSKHGATATAVSSSCRVFSRRTVSDSATGNAPPASCTYAIRTPGADAGDDRSELAVQPAADDGKPVELPPPARRAPRRRPRRTARACREAPSRAPRGRRQSEPPRQVRVDDVEAAGAEAEVAALRVDAGPCRRPRPDRSAADRRRTAPRRPRSG